MCDIDIDSSSESGMSISCLQEAMANLNTFLAVNRALLSFHGEITISVPST